MTPTEHKHIIPTQTWLSTLEEQQCRHCGCFEASKNGNQNLKIIHEVKGEHEQI